MHDKCALARTWNQISIEIFWRLLYIRWMCQISYIPNTEPISRNFSFSPSSLTQEDYWLVGTSIYLGTGRHILHPKLCQFHFSRFMNLCLSNIIMFDEFHLNLETS